MNNSTTAGKKPQQFQTNQGGAKSSPSSFVLDDSQFKQLRRDVLTAGIVSGYLAKFVSSTNVVNDVTLRNLKPRIAAIVEELL